MNVKKYGIGEPVFEYNSGVFTLTFYLKDEKTVEKIISLIKNNPEISNRELQQKTGLSRRGVEWQIQKLKSENKIKRVGPDKGGYWKIL